MLFGAELNIHTDHRHILNVGDSSECRLRWISYVDEYGPTLHYVEGPLNVIVDIDSSALVGKKAASVVSDSERTAEYSSLIDDREILECLLNLPCLHLKKKESKRPKKRRNLEQDSHHIDHCYLNLSENMIENNPLSMENINEKQDQYADLQQSATRHPEWYSCKDINSIANVLCYTRPNDGPSNWKITLLNELIEPTVQWYQQVTGHPGSKRLYEHINQRYYNRDIRKHIDRFNCNYCQRNKLEGRGYGLLPEREV